MAIKDLMKECRMIICWILVQGARNVSFYVHITASTKHFAWRSMSAVKYYDLEGVIEYEAHFMWLAGVRRTST